MMRIAAVDDEVHVLERFERMVVDMDQIELCGLFETGRELLDYMDKNPLDVVFLDIEMPDINGLELSEAILSQNENIDIVFVTAFNQYAVEAFELQALDYILKPLTEERLAKTMKRLQKVKRTVGLSEMPSIQCIGEFEVSVDGEIMAWKNSKAKEILAFLVHKNGAPVDWEKIADAVWPDYDREKAQTNFHATTYLLRKRLKEVGISHILESGRGRYRIIVDQIKCDIHHMEELAKDSSVHRKEYMYLVEQLKHRGYMEDNGYEWARPRSAQLDEICRKIIENHL